MERRVRTTLITTALGLALLAPTALAQTTACPTDPFITDATGDQAIDPSGQGVKQLTQPGPDNMDITGVSFAWHKDAAGKQVLSADIGIANMTMDTMPLYDSQAGNWYYLWFSVGGTQYFLKAINADGSGMTYSYGLSDAKTVPNFTVYDTSGDTTGRVVLGKNGHVIIDFPSQIPLPLGTEVDGIYADADGIQGKDDFYGVNNHVDSTDTGIGVVDACGINVPPDDEEE